MIYIIKFNAIEISFETKSHFQCGIKSTDPEDFYLFYYKNAFLKKFVYLQCLLH